jgi:hypothetical protein
MSEIVIATESTPFSKVRSGGVFTRRAGDDELFVKLAKPRRPHAASGGKGSSAVSLSTGAFHNFQPKTRVLACIVLDNVTLSVPFSEVCVGTWFHLIEACAGRKDLVKLADMLYRAEPMQTARGYNAVELESGQPYSIDDDRQVVIVEKKL